jgi:hypothetical protein
MKHNLITLAFITCQLLSAQTVTLASGEWKDRGINLAYSPTGSFENLAPSTISASAIGYLNPLYPFSFTLENTADKIVIAFSVRWTCTDPRGVVRTHDRTISNLHTFTGGQAIAPRTVRLVTPVMTLSNLSVVPDAQSKAASSSVTEALRMLQGQRSVVISLESVIFDDGAATGTDANGAITQIRARLDAERSLLEGLTEAWQRSGTSAGVMAFLEPLALNHKLAGTLAASRMDAATAYSAIYSDTQAQIAGAYLQEAARDVSGLADRAQRTLATKKYPLIH